MRQSRAKTALHSARNAGRVLERLPIGLWHQLLLVAICWVMFFVNLGATRLWDVDEAIFARTAREMVQRGDWVVPYFNGEIMAHKPPLMYWAMIAGYKMFGDVELAARFWSAVFAIGSVLVTYHLGRILMSRTVGLWAGVALASSLNFAVIARAATPDAELVFFSSLAILIPIAAKSRWWLDPASTSPPSDAAERTADWPTWASWALAYAVMGIATLVKGPIGVVLPTAVLGLFLLCRGNAHSDMTAQGQADARSKRLFSGYFEWIRQTFAPLYVVKTVWRMRPLTALALVAAVAGPWYLAVGLRTDGQWLAGFFGVHNVGRFLNAMDNHAGPLFYYVPAIMVGFFPWSIFLVPSLILLYRRIRRHHAWRPAYQLICCWIAVYVGFFSLASTKLPSYIVPAYPALALFTGAFIVAWLQRPEIVHRNWLRGGWLILGLVGVALLIVIPIASHKFLHGDRLSGIFGLAPLVGAVAALWYFEHGQPRRAMLATAGASVMMITAVLGFAAVRVDRHQNSELLADAIREHATGRSPAVACYQYFRPSLVFYVDHPIERFISAPQACEFFRTHPENAFLITLEDHYVQYAKDLPPGVTVLESSPFFLRRGQVLLLGRKPGAEHARATDKKPVLRANSAAGAVLR